MLKIWVYSHVPTQKKRITNETSAGCQDNRLPQGGIRAAGMGRVPEAPGGAEGVIR